jgi:hypothetical protein
MAGYNAVVSLAPAAVTMAGLRLMREEETS